MTLKRIVQTEPSAAPCETDGILHLLQDVAPYAYSAAVSDQQRLRHWLRVRDVDSYMGCNFISEDDDGIGFNSAVELADEVFVLVGRVSTAPFFDALPEAVHSTGPLSGVSMPCIAQLSEDVLKRLLQGTGCSALLEDSSPS